MSANIIHVLFLCTGNSARSILAEALLNHRGGDWFRAYSAGSFPAGEVNPYTLRLLGDTGIHPPEPLRSKSWDEFACPGAPVMDCIITVCDQAAGEVCPVWPGQPLSAHWGLADPAAVSGPEAERMDAFRTTYRELDHRIRLLCNAPRNSPGPAELRERLEHIAHATAPQTPPGGE